MHLVTSALLLPSLINSISAASAVLLFKAYFTFSLLWYIARGRAPVPVSDFYEATAELSNGPVKAPESAPNTLPPENNPNPWLPIIQTTLVHPNEHLCKLQRALLYFAEMYGGTPKGAFADMGMEGLDGTIFVRVASLTADRLGWMREGQHERKWDFNGFFHEESSL